MDWEVEPLYLPPPAGLTYSLTLETLRKWRALQFLCKTLIIVISKYVLLSSSMRDKTIHQESSIDPSPLYYTYQTLREEIYFVKYCFYPVLADKPLTE